MKSTIICCICVFGLLMASMPVSAHAVDKIFGEAEAKLYSDDNLYVDVDDIQNWIWVGHDEIYVVVTTKWMDKTIGADDFRLVIDLDMWWYPHGYPGVPDYSWWDGISIDDNSAAYINDQWFTDEVKCGPIYQPLGGVYECWLHIQMWNDDQDEYDVDEAHWFITA